VWLHAFFSSIDSEEWSASRSSHFTLEEILIPGFMGPTAGLDTMEEVEFILSSTKIQFKFPQCQCADSTTPSTGDVFTDDVTPGRFPIKVMLKWGGWFQAMLSARKVYIYTCEKKLTKI